MTEQVIVVSTPQLGVNDEIATVVQWYVPEESIVSAGDPICGLETSKAVFDVEAEARGHLLYLVDVGTEVTINQPIALIGLGIEELRSEQARYKSAATAKGIGEDTATSSGPGRATRKARELALQLGVDLAKIRTNEIVREHDVVRYHAEINGPQPNSEIELSWTAGYQPVIIYGAARGAVTLKECLDFHDLYTTVCFLDDDPQHPQSLCGLPVYHGTRLVEILELGVQSLACAIAKAEVRIRILRECDRLGIELINVLHPRAYLAPTVRLGRGNYVKSGAVIETNTVIGDCCIIDNGAVIPHDNVVGNGCHIAPGVAMGSGIEIGERTIVGIGASISTGVKIGRGAILSVGCSVTQNVPDFAVVAGVPGKVVGKSKILE